MTKVKRCPWAESDPFSCAYHDQEWGVTLHDDKKLFEFLFLEGAQAGLSWSTVLKKRAHYEKVFDGFDPRKVSLYDYRKIEKLLSDPGIIRNRLKIEAAISNAKCFLAIQKEFGTFDTYIYQFTSYKTKKNTWKTISEVPASTPESDAMSKELKRRGFRFVGSTICYAFMQAIGMVNDHITSCYRYKAVAR